MRAKELHVVQGKSVYAATLQASALRLRPILMTSFAFILGVVPLWLASGGRREMRRSLGIAWRMPYCWMGSRAVCTAAQATLWIGNWRELRAATDGSSWQVV